jgi:ribosomal peptide maturation radical SAM protein 1
LQACAREAGFDVTVFYANLQFAARIGEQRYEAIVEGHPAQLGGERVFARAAFCRRTPGVDLQLNAVPISADDGFTPDDLIAAEQAAVEFCQDMGARIAAFDCDVVGCSSSFDQTAASVALLAAVKRMRPETVTIIGGANCEGEMAEAIAALAPDIDHVFAGECEDAFPGFLRTLQTCGRGTTERIVRGAPCRDLNAIPPLDYSEYFQQSSDVVPQWRERQIWVQCETSRGCWWGQKSHCTFCGLNGEGMAFRQKRPDRALDELLSLTARHPSCKMAVTDNIMPHNYFSTVLPRLAEQKPDTVIFYEQKANLTLAKARLLARAGITYIQPGIEALSTPLLQRMRKGVSARQNIALLRYCRSLDILPRWNLLADFPGDTIDDYSPTLALLPLLHHLHPPNGVSRLSIDRFSPYFDEPARFGITAVEPVPAYRDAFPPGTDLHRLAYHFTGQFHSSCRDDPTIIARLQDGVVAWRAAWLQPDQPPPVLHVTPLGDNAFLLIDSRGIEGCPEFRVLDRAQAAATLVGAPIERAPLAPWAITAKFAVVLDDWSVPLATADDTVLDAFEAGTAA